MPTDHGWKNRVEEWIREREIDRMLDVGNGVDDFAHKWKDRVDPDEAVERIVNLFYKIMKLGPPIE